MQRLTIGLLVLACVTGRIVGQDNPYIPNLNSKQQSLPSAPMGGLAPYPGCVVEDHSCGCGGVIGGAGFYYLKPYFGSNPVFLSAVNETVGNVSATRSNTQDFNWEYHLAPKVWLGYVFNSGWGFVADYWHFQGSPANVQIIHAADTAGTITNVNTVGALPIVARSNIAPIAPDVINVNSDLHLDVCDFELAKVGAWDCLSYKMTFGGRYVQLRQTYNASLVNPANPGPVNEQQNESYSFFGAGPTVSGDLNYRFFRGFGLYGNARFSLLFGKSHEEATQTQTGVVFNPAFEVSADRQVTVPVGEIEMGISWQADWNRLQFFLKSGFSAQMWWGAGSASVPAGGTFPSQGAQSPQGPFFPISTATHSDLGFLGWTFSAGIRY